MILINGLTKFVRLILILTSIVSVELFAADLLVINADIRTSDPLMLSADGLRCFPCRDRILSPVAVSTPSLM